MTRKIINKEDEATVLTMCRRRCCVCYGLNRDVEIKKGQIAHLDRDSSNSKLDNLAFLCFDHHDQYDSKSSQSKNFTISEVRTYRKELHEVISTEWKKPVQIIPEPIFIGIGGHYIRENKYENAEFTIISLGTNQYQIEGFTLWGTQNPYGPSSGSLEFNSELKDGKLSFEDPSKTNTYKLELTFDGDKLKAIEEIVPGYFGLNASFGGDYVRVK